MAGTLAKPQLRGHLNRQIGRNLLFASLLTASAGILFKVLYMDPKKKKYAEFFKTYDPEAEFRRMRDLGLFQSCEPGED